MSKVSIQGDVSGTGDFTIKAPNSNVDRTLNLPDEAGTVLTNVSDIESQVKTATNATGSAPVYACRAWVNFQGTGTVSIRDSGNVSSITDNGTGDYTVNFATAISDNDYAAVATANQNLASNGTNISVGYYANIGEGPYSTTQLRMLCKFSGPNAFDPPTMSVAVFR